MPLGMDLGASYDKEASKTSPAPESGVLEAIMMDKMSRATNFLRSNSVHSVDSACSGHSYYSTSSFAGDSDRCACDDCVLGITDFLHDFSQTKVELNNGGGSLIEKSKARKHSDTDFMTCRMAARTYCQCSRNVTSETRSRRLGKGRERLFDILLSREANRVPRWKEEDGHHQSQVQYRPDQWDAVRCLQCQGIKWESEAERRRSDPFQVRRIISSLERQNLIDFIEHQKPENLACPAAVLCSPSNVPGPLSAESGCDSSNQIAKVVQHGEQASNHNEGKIPSGWRKLRSMVQWTPFIQTYKHKRYQWVQLAGHSGNFKAGKSQGTVLKKLCAQEEVCYRKLDNDAMVQFVPKYQGVLTLDDDEKFIQLQDCLSSFTNPSIMDCKIGVRTYLEEELAKAKEKPKLRRDMYDKMIAVDSSAPTEEEHKLKGVQYLERLRVIRSSLEGSKFFHEHELIGSSLLFVHDSKKASIWLIDFGKTVPLPSGVVIDHKSPWEVGNHEDGYLIGIDNLVNIMAQVVSLDRSKPEDTSVSSRHSSSSSTRPKSVTKPPVSSSS
eukprot:maker-scaffold204_size260821-snap-gene-1.45 protein:Tk07820 transcript:maker-scaffold204_size260821-snap-gene-1.45-mRNA-1 annotation:"GE17061"